MVFIENFCVVLIEIEIIGVVEILIEFLDFKDFVLRKEFWVDVDRKIESFDVYEVFVIGN